MLLAAQFVTLTAVSSLVVLQDPGPKRSLLQAISALRREPSVQCRNTVLDAIRTLEAEGTTSGAVDGRWSLVFSTQLPETASSGPTSPLQQLSDSLYGVFFKVAPALAGAQADGRGRESNEQRLDLETGELGNRVRIPLPASDSILELMVRVDVGLNGGGSVRVPLPNPVGSLRTTFCDDEVRVSRGGRGGVFVLKRLT
jgi:hypothetical protein